MRSLKFHTPVGCLLIVEEEEFIVKIDIRREKEQSVSPTNETALLIEAKNQLNDYFSGKRTTFNLPLRPAGTAFQRKCWKVLEDIPYGTTISYGEEAEQVGGKNYSRAVGMANGRNPIPIIIPCHRVIGSNGKLTGYSLGLDMKQQLLQLEGISLND